MLDARSQASPTVRPTSRADLIARWTAARRRRDAAPLGSDDHAKAVIEVGEIEVEINAFDVQASEGRAVQPARGAEIEHS